MFQQNENIRLNKVNRCLGEVQMTVEVYEIEKVKSFKYLGLMVNVKNEDWMTISFNLRKAKSQWGRFQKVLLYTTLSPHTEENFYKYILQSTLLYVSETWVVSGMMMKNS